MVHFPASSGVDGVIPRIPVPPDAVGVYRTDCRFAIADCRLGPCSKHTWMDRRNADFSRQRRTTARRTGGGFGCSSRSGTCCRMNPAFRWSVPRTPTSVGRDVRRRGDAQRAHRCIPELLVVHGGDPERRALLSPADFPVGSVGRLENRHFGSRSASGRRARPGSHSRSGPGGAMLRVPAETL